MKVGLVTLFPDLVHQALGHSILGRAQAGGRLEVSTVNPRDFATDVHRTVDAPPFGGGPGMVMMAPVALKAVEQLAFPPCPILVMDPAGEPFSQPMARELSLSSHLILVCGRYEGLDERIIDILGARPVSVGDFVLTGGELPSLMIVDAVTRLIPGVLGDPGSHEDDSHGEDGLLGFPLYTKPQTVEGSSVPEVLLSGDHRAIAAWRRTQQLLRTRRRRPDLFAKAKLSRQDIGLLSRASEVPQDGPGTQD